MNKGLITFFKAFKKKYNEEGIFKESAALTFITLLGFVPFIIFLLFFLPELPFLKLQSHFKELLISVFLPDSAEQISEFVTQLASKKIPFNLFNFIILMITSFSLFKIINDSFDRILNVHEFKKKDFLSNFIKFLGMTIFGGLVILILFSASSLPLVSKFITLPFLQGISLYFTPFILLFIIFSLGFFFIPTIKVKNTSVMIGSAISAIIWIIFKSLFNWYIVHLTNIELIFGVLASLPIFLFWIYANWIIILSGVIIVSILENRHLKPELEKKENKLRIILEKSIAGGEPDHISSQTMKPEELKQILSDVILGCNEENENKDD